MVKRSPLVVQHLEKISRKLLDKYQDVIRQYVKGRHGIYALYDVDKLYYVGLASNLRNRLRHHLNDRHGQSWDRFSIYLTIGDGHMKELESLFLRIFKPIGNKCCGKFVTSQDLRGQLAKDMREHLRNEMDLLIGRRKNRCVWKKGADLHPEVSFAVLAAYPNRPKVLKATYKGRTIKARVRWDGSIRFNGKVYQSPSSAGAAAVNRRSCDGWNFWRYERAPGDWVKLDVLRK